MVNEIWKDIPGYEGLYHDKNMKKIKIWYCISDVERTLGINHTTIIRCAKHKQKTAGEYRWEYVL